MLGGVLDFSSVPQTWPALEKLLRSGGQLTLSLADIRRANSAGLVMLVEARDRARRNNCRLQLVDLPSGLLDLARMSGCEELVAQNDA
jgi:phospholipid transport system transporter-binding protein